MPFYEYQCQECGHRLEAMQKMSDEPLRECPACGKAALKKLISSGSFGSKSGSIDNAPPCAGGGCGAACLGK
ncbi:MAG TPA: zinc ribbon domain-containing protein [Gammaproteobacteria bacterium]